MLGCLAVVLVSGCSTSFNRHWRAAQRGPAPAGALGAWQGSWVSEASGHQGKLRCLIEPKGPTGHQAWFRANYAGILSFGYKVPLQLTPAGDRQELQGAANLGVLVGGNYTYQGYVTSTNFFSTYRCRVDHGRFELRRPDPTAPPPRR